MDSLSYNLKCQNISNTNFYINTIECYPQHIVSTNPQERFIQQFHNLVPQEKNLSIEEKNYFHQLYDLLNYFQSFFPQFNSSFEIGIAGGSLRDVFTKKFSLIKDIDIIISLPNIPKSLHSSFLRDVQKQLHMKHTIFKNFEHQMYYSKHLFSNIKIPQEFSFPVDLIFTNDSIEDFVQTFDFSICKIYYKHNPRELDDDYDLENWQKIYRKIIFTPTFLKDLHDKTITLNLRNFEENEIHYFLTHHYQRIKNKYSEYSLNIINGKEQMKEKIYFEILQKEISQQSTSQKKLKI
jgi:hypothetical protein